MRTKVWIALLCMGLIGGLLGACAPTDTARIDALAAEVVSGMPQLDFEMTPIPTKTPLPPTPTPTLAPGDTGTSPIDGMRMIYIPQGSFIMGSNTNQFNEKPQREVMLDAFWIDKSEVTNAMYAMCVAAGACAEHDHFDSRTRDDYYTNPVYADFPVISVHWVDAKTYCEWAGRRLPTEAQWEKAARGTDGYIYPWGDETPSENLANYDSIVGDTTEVCSYPGGNSPYGVCDMAGNAFEWVADWYEYEYYGSAPVENPTGPSSGGDRVTRGGSYRSAALLIRTASRKGAGGSWTNYEYGFRCAAPAQP